MTRRPTRVPHIAPATRELSSDAKLLYQEMVSPVEQAANTALAALDSVRRTAGALLLKMDGLDQEDGWRLDLDIMKYRKLSQAEIQNGKKG